MTEGPRFTVIKGDSEKVDARDLVPDLISDPMCQTFGELFADFAYQIRRGEYANVLHRLNQCTDLYGHVALPPDVEDAG